MQIKVHSRLQWHPEHENACAQSMTGFRQRRSSIDNAIDLAISVQESKAQEYITVAVFPYVKAAYENMEYSGILRTLKEIIPIYTRKRH